MNTDTSAAPVRDSATRSDTLSSHPTANIWACLRSPINRVDAARALLGLDAGALRQLGAAEMLTTPIAGNLLDNGPRILEQPGFPHAHLDLAAEVAAGLNTLNSVGTALEAIPTWAYDDENLRHARSAYARSTALAGHSAFHEEAVRSGAEARPCKLFADAALSLRTLIPLVDARTERQHQIFLSMLAIASEAGIHPDVDIVDNTAICGRIAYRHPVNRGADEPSGIRVGTLLFDVPDYRGEPSAIALDRLTNRSKGLTPILLDQSDDVALYEEVIRTQLVTSAHI